MPDASPAERRKDPLSKARVVAAAVDLLDAEGESALTFRALARRLSTGSGAIYWHVEDKHALLSAAVESVLSGATSGAAEASHPVEALRAIALGVFDAIQAHPWVGTHLAREPWQPAMADIFESSGAQFEAIGVPQAALFHCASALVQFLLGAAAQTAAAARHRFRACDRPAVLATIVDAWTERDPANHPVVHRLADEMRTHDERDAFLAGLNLILSGALAVAAASGTDAGASARSLHAVSTR